MITKAYAVIGLNYGDEGKGLTTDYLCSKSENPIVVRFSGGANAGHTVVVEKDGIQRRHVFSHFGAGTLNYVPTFWSKYALANPILFNKEYKELLLDSNFSCITTPFFIDYDSPVTTPIDMIANQLEERRKGRDSHSTCGVGIHNTVIRENNRYSLKVGDLVNLVFSDGTIEQKISTLTALLDFLVSYYNLTDTIDKKRVQNIGQLFYKECYDFISTVKICSFDYIKNTFHTLVFEGSQGVGLSCDRASDGRYLTEAYTDLNNIREMWQDPITVFGVTRPYLTRHGKGYLENETEKPFSLIDEKTNVDNEWQGAFRYGILDATTLLTHWRWLEEKKTPQMEFNLMMTCLDHIPSNGGLGIIRSLTKDIPYKEFYGSFGPTRKDVGFFGEKIA